MRLLYFSPVNWDSYYQRPHYMIHYFLDKNPENTVLWINPYPTRFPVWQDIFRKLNREQDKAMPCLNSGRLEVISPKALPIEPLRNSEKINYFLFWKKYWKKIENFCSLPNSNYDLGANIIIGVGRPSKFALLALEKLKYQYSFYDAMDDFPEFYSGLSRQSMLKVEKNISEKAEKIFVSSTVLYEKFSSKFSNKLIKILNGYDMSSLPSLANPNVIASKQNPIIFGFVGTIGKWFDWSVVVALAKQFPEAVVRLVGPQYVKYSGVLPNNIETFPECSQSEAVKYVSEFDVGLIPFKQNALTQGVDPIKYYEYRAMGLPILSARFGEMLYRSDKDGVYFLGNDNIDKISVNNSNRDKLFSYHYDIEGIKLFRKENDWKTRFSLCEFPS